MNRYTRLSAAGASALSIWRVQVDASTQAALFHCELVPGAIQRVRVVAGAGSDGEFIDDALATALDDGSIEVSLHGGMGVAQAWQERLVELGCIAAPVEDWQDLPAASVALARSPLAARVAWSSQTYASDWAEAQRVGLARAFAAERLRYRPLTELLNQPPRLALVGPTNAGKSSIFNALVRHERVTVSPHPGTTRDAVEVSVLLGSGPDALEWTWVDTAGLWAEASGVDDLAVAQSRREAQSAWGRVWVFDHAARISPELRAWLASAAEQDVLLWNQSDRGETVADEGLAARWPGPVLRGSARTDPQALVAQLEAAWLKSLPPLPPVGLALPENPAQWDELEAASARRG